MASWRTTTPPPVQDDLDALVTLASDRAQDLLKKYGEFFPFGVNMNDQGQDGFFDADPGLGEHPASLEVLEVLYVLASSASASWRAFGVVADITFNGSDAVRIVAEHQDVATTLVFTVPYTRKGLLRKTVTHGQMTTDSGEKLAWTD
ncbi:MAG: hypothetical protein ACYDDU_05015 [Dermatophilaceae bacterium]